MKVIIIPGGQIVAKDSTGPLLLVRCEAALELFRTGKYDYILTTGGLTHSRKIQTLPEAEIVKRWLVSKGVPEESIICESLSLDSFGNIQFGFRALQEKGMQPTEITVVSQWQHTIRYWITLRLGIHFPGKIQLVMLHPKIGLKASLFEWAFILYHLLDPLGKGKMVQRHRERIRKNRES